jgi:hypothetical protein
MNERIEGDHVRDEPHHGRVANVPLTNGGDAAGHGLSESQEGSVCPSPPIQINGDHKQTEDHARAVANGGGGDQNIGGSHMPGVSTVSETCATLKALLRARNFAIVQRMGIISRQAAFIRVNYLGWTPDLTKAESIALCKRAKAIIKAVKKGTDGGKDAAIVHEVSPQVTATLTAVAPFEAMQKGIDKERERLVKTLPVWPWVQSVKGLGVQDVANIIGETGDLCNYATKGKVWKRMEMAVMPDGRRQRKVRGKEALEHNYGGRRAAVVWVMARALFQHQWRGEKDDVPAHPVGPYGEKYARKKAEYMERAEATADLPDRIGEQWNEAKWTKAHADNAARRYMAKELLRDLWKAWRRASKRHMD